MRHASRFMWITLKCHIAILRASAFLWAHAIKCTADHTHAHAHSEIRTHTASTQASKVRTECYWQQMPCKTVAKAKAKANAITGATQAQANFSISRTEAPLTSTNHKLLIELAFLRMVSAKCNIPIDILKIEHLSSMLLLASVEQKSHAHRHILRKPK